MPYAMYDEMRAALNDDLAELQVVGTGSLASAFPTTELATASMGAAGACLAGLVRADKRNENQLEFQVDRRLASMWFAWSLRPHGWEVPPAMDPIAGDYEGRDGWIRLHTNAPHHHDAALKVLGCASDREAVGKAVARCSIDDLETDIVAQGGCAAAMRLSMPGPYILKAQPWQANHLFTRHSSTPVTCLHGHSMQNVRSREFAFST